MGLCQGLGTMSRRNTMTSARDTRYSTGTVRVIQREFNFLLHIWLYSMWGEQSQDILINSTKNLTTSSCLSPAMETKKHIYKICILQYDFITFLSINVSMDWPTFRNIYLQITDDWQGYDHTFHSWSLKNEEFLEFLSLSEVGSVSEFLPRIGMYYLMRSRGRTWIWSLVRLLGPGDED